jgi:hypothetical protein
MAGNKLTAVGQFAVAAVSDRRNLLNQKAGGRRPPLQQIKLTHYQTAITLTDDQQKQIKAATGKSITEFNIDFASLGNLSEKDLEKVAGGFKSILIEN